MSGVQVDVCALAELEEGRPLAVATEGLRLAVVRLADEVFALHDRCPHQGAALCRGAVGSRIGFEGGTVVAQRDAPVIACPWHHWEFDLRSGRSLFDDRYRVRTFPTTVVDGRVVVELRRR